jgi:Skp family chaperone for outer membrane proteins
MVKNKNFLLLGISAAALSLSIKNFSHGDRQAGSQKIVVVNSESLLKLLPEFENVETEFKTYVTSEQDIQKKRLDYFEKMVKDLEKNEGELSGKEKEIRRANLHNEERKLQREQVEFQRKLQAKNAEGMRYLKEILEKKYLDHYAKANGIDLVFDSEVCEKCYDLNYDITAAIAALIEKDKGKTSSSTAKK